MAGGKVKKGFTDYLVILFFLIIAAFLTIVVIMLFSPFKTILGLQYFAYDYEEYHYNVINSNNVDVSTTNLDFSNIQEINVNCDYAQVQVSRFVKVDDISIRIQNWTKGFATSGQDTSFDYDIYYKEGSNNRIINIDIHEPEGFVYFNKSVKIDILIPSVLNDEGDNGYALENTTLNVNSTSGNIYIGSNATVSRGESDIGLNSFNLKTLTGSIVVFPYIEENLTNVFLKSETGNIDIRSDVYISNSFQINANNSMIDLNSITMPTDKAITMNINNSKIFADDITGNIDLTLRSGYIEFNNLNGSLISNNAVDQMDSANIRINKINEGNVSLPYANNSSIRINEVISTSNGTKGQVYIHATGGEIQLGSVDGESWIETTSGNVTMSTNSNDISIKTTTGKINVTYNSSTIDNELNFESTTGDINVNIKSNLAYYLEVYNTNNELRSTGSLFVEYYDKEFANPMSVNNGTKHFTVISNASVSINLIKESA